LTLQTFSFRYAKDLASTFPIPVFTELLPIHDRLPINVNAHLQIEMLADLIAITRRCVGWHVQETIAYTVQTPQIESLYHVILLSLRCFETMCHI
jgi:hypothetical protein